MGIRVFGRVQGVSFRAAAQDAARDLGLAGFARNEPDGSVYIEVEGEEPQIQQFVAWCQGGPEDAAVEKVETKRQPLRDHDGFHIERETGGGNTPR